MRKCPYCAEEIQPEAIKCKHCGEWLEESEQTERTEKVVHAPISASEITYPTILRRYMATFIDGMLILTVMILASYIFSHDTDIARILRVSIILSMFLIYEPFLTSKICTLGQKIMGVRVRNVANLERISLFQAYVRIIVKIFLGIISFFSIIFSSKKRAIHDFAASSIVIEVTSIEVVAHHIA